MAGQPPNELGFIIFVIFAAFIRRVVDFFNFTNLVSHYCFGKKCYSLLTGAYRLRNLLLRMAGHPHIEDADGLASSSSPLSSEGPSISSVFCVWYPSTVCKKPTT